MCFAAVGGLVLSSENESRTRDAVASKKRPSTLRRRLLRDAATRALRFAARCPAASLLKVQNRTARKPYIEDKEVLEEVIPNYRRLDEGSVSAKTIKKGFLSRAGPFDRIPARAASAIGAKAALQPSNCDAQPLPLRKRPPRRQSLKEFKSSIADRAAARQQKQR